MRCMYFTTAKPSTERCLKWLYENCAEVTVVFYKSGSFGDTSFVRYCREKGIPMITHEDAEEYLNRTQIDILISHIYPGKIKRNWIEMVKREAFNIHPAPLPKYRGLFCYNHAILNNEKEYGVTAHRLAEGFDMGDIIEVSNFAYDCGNGWLDEMVRTAEEHMYQLLVKLVTKVINNELLTSYPQGEGAYYSMKDFEQAKKITPKDTEEMINRKIRAFWYPPYEGAYIEAAGHRYTLVNEEVLQKLKDGKM